MRGSKTLRSSEGELSARAASGSQNLPTILHNRSRGLWIDDRPEASPVGLAITAAALFIMPGLAWAKRRTAKTTENRALAADAVQSATCAYLAAITLVGLAMNAVFHVGWIDSVAALAAVPILVIEGRQALHGKDCTCC